MREPEQDNNWVVDGRYYSDEADARFWRQLQQERRERDRARMAQARTAKAA